MSALDDDLELVHGIVATHEHEHSIEFVGGEALARIRADIKRLRDLAQDAFDHPNFTPEPGDERLK